MAQFVVDSETIAAKAAQAKTQVANISAEVTGMTASLQDLQGSWTGSASTNWRGTQKRVEESITQINEALDRAGVNYAETENANAAMFVG